MNIITFFLLLFLYLLSYKINLIYHDSKIHIYLKNQYFKTTKKKTSRCNIYDKNNILLNYNKKKYKYTKKKKLIIEQREYLFPSCLSITGISDNQQSGLSGLELFFDTKIRKHNIKTYVSRSTAKEQFIPILFEEKKNNIITTLDALQSQYIYKKLKKKVKELSSEYALCIIMDGNTGSIETLTQYPQYQEKNKDIASIKFLYPLSITQAHEVGSVIKAFLMIAALNEELVTAETEINCFNTKKKLFHGKMLTTWKAHGIIPFKTVITESNNFGVAQIGYKLGAKLYDYYTDFGFGKKTNISIHGEHEGILHHPSKWSKRTPITLSFGYEMSCTLLQLVCAWSLLTNNGKKLTPRLSIDETAKEAPPKLSQKTIEAAKEILFLDQIKLKNYGLKNKINAQLYGKTGTANLLINKQYSQTDNSYTFVGHIEKNNCTKIIGIYIYKSNDSSLYASQTALPLFLDIAEYLDKKL